MKTFKKVFASAMVTAMLATMGVSAFAAMEASTWFGELR